MRKKTSNEDVNTKANVNTFDFLLNTFTLEFVYLNVILFVLRTTL